MLSCNIGAADTNNQRSRNSDHTDQNKTNGEHTVQPSENAAGIMCT